MSMDIHYQDSRITVYTDDLVTKDGYRHPQGVFKVTSKLFRSKTFKGETAWSDAQSYVNDQLWKVGERGNVLF